MLSEPERRFITDGIAQNLRTDGRQRFDHRPWKIETDISPQTHGSASVKIDTTEVFAMVRADVGEPSREHPGRGRLLCNVTCPPIAAVGFEQDGARDLNIRLTRALEDVLAASDCIDLDALGLIHGSSCWILQIEVMVLDNAGSLFDAICLAVKAALLTCQIPVVEVVQGGAEDPNEKDVQLVESIPAVSEEQLSSPAEGKDDLDKDFQQLSIVQQQQQQQKSHTSRHLVAGSGLFQPLPLRTIPVCITFTKVGDYFVVDSTAEEEACMETQCTVCVTPDEEGKGEAKVCHISKRGPGGLATSTVEQMAKVAEKMGAELHRKMLESLMEGLDDADDEEEEDVDL